MAGSWHHAIDEQGRLLNSFELSDMLENGGDVHEFAEEVYGMVYYLAGRLIAHEPGGLESLIEEARMNYREGISVSPGLNE